MLKISEMRIYSHLGFFMHIYGATAVHEESEANLRAQLVALAQQRDRVANPRVMRVAWQGNVAVSKATSAPAVCLVCA